MQIRQSLEEKSPYAHPGVKYAFQILKKLRILTPKFIEKIINDATQNRYLHSTSIQTGLKILEEKGLLTLANVKDFMEYHVTGYFTAYNLIELDSLGISTEKNRKLACQVFDYGCQIPKALYLLWQKNLLNDESYAYLENNLDVLDTSNRLEYYLKFKTFMEDHHSTKDILTILQSLRMEMIMCFLGYRSLNTKENEIKVSSNLHQGKAIYYFILRLYSASMLDQKNFDLVIQHASFLPQYLQFNYYQNPKLINYAPNATPTYYLTKDIFKKIIHKNLGNTAMECAQIQYASRQKLHFFNRAPDDVLKYIYSFIIPGNEEQKMHFTNNIFKLPYAWKNLPSKLKKHKISFK